MFELIVLANLMIQPCYGYELKGKLKQLNPNNNKIYPLLKKLAQQKLVEASTMFQEGKPNKKIYTITEKGRQYFIERLAEFDEVSAQNLDQFSIRMAFSYLLPRETVQKIILTRERALSVQSNVTITTQLPMTTDDSIRLLKLIAELRNVELSYLAELKKKYDIVEH